MSLANIFVSTSWLAEHLDDPDLVVVDGSWHLPTAGRNGGEEFLARHIPGAVHFDIDAIADRDTDLPHMLPTPEAFAAAVGALGIGNDKKVVVYDTEGLFSAPRVRWTLKVFGLEDVRILEGGLPRWLAEGRPTQSGSVHPAPVTFTPHFDAAQVADTARVVQALASADAQVLDARPEARFKGDVPEIRPGVRPGHMPGALNLPASLFIAEGTLLPADKIEALVKTAGVDLTHPVITSCGSGVTAAILSLALESIGHPPKALYDGSWTQWSSSGQAVVTG